MSNAGTEDEMLQTVISYKSLAIDSGNHHLMMKDKTIIQFLAYSLDSEDHEVVKTALEALELLTKNPFNKTSIRSTYGIVEAINAVRERPDLPSELKNIATELWKTLQAEGPVYTGRTRSKATLIPESNSEKNSSSSYTFHVFGLNSESRYDLENVLIRIKGVISVLVDVEHLRCTVKTIPKITPEIIAETIFKRTKMQAHLVILNRNKQEVLKDVLKKEDEADGDTTKDDSLPPYLEEEASPVKEKALLSFDQLRTGATLFIRTAAELFQNSFYW